MRDEIDHRDLLILSNLYKDKSLSLRDLCKLIIVKNPSGVLYRVRKMEGLGLLAPPPTVGQHRSRVITQRGIDLLKQQRLI